MQGIVSSAGRFSRFAKRPQAGPLNKHVHLQAPASRLAVKLASWRWLARLPVAW